MDSRLFGIREAWGTERGKRDARGLAKLGKAGFSKNCSQGAPIQVNFPAHHPACSVHDNRNFPAEF